MKSLVSRHLYSRIAISLAFFAFAIVSASAESITISSIPERIRTSNPTLVAARLRIEEARGRFQGAGRLSNPALGLQMVHDRKFEEGTLTLTFDQAFPLTARLRLEKVLSHKAIAAAELEIRDAERRLIADAQTVAVKVVFMARQKQLRQQQAQLAGDLLQFISKRAQQGEISSLEAAQAEVDKQRRLLEINQIEVEIVALLGELRLKLGSRADISLAVADTLPEMATPASMVRGNPLDQQAARPGVGKTDRSDVRPMYGPALRPDYLRAKLAEETSKVEVDLARANKWQDVSAGVILEGSRSRDEPEGLSNDVYMGFRISVPLPLWNQNQGAILEKQASAVRAKLETRALVTDIQNETEQARQEMAANGRLANESRDRLLPLVLKQTERLEEAYKKGEGDLMTVLRSREQRLALESAILDASRNYHLARVRYDAATGRFSAAARR